MKEITRLFGESNVEFVFFENTCPPGPPEDKYGHFAMLKKLNDTYRCHCGSFFIYKDDSFKTLICPNPKCGFEKPAPPILQR
ncbi:MAG: hypothetical protein PHD31_02490 [Candidatus Pacebacteria bacterium]|nr:hypothetical protein [Candidatus Paceibacterota bacterium]